MGEALHGAVGDWVAAWLERVLEGDGREQLARALLEHHGRCVPEVAMDPALRDDLDRSNRAMADKIFATLPHAPREHDVLPEAALDLARAMARRRIESSVLLRTYRAGQDFYWRLAMASVLYSEATVELRALILQHIWDHWCALANSAIDRAVEAYAEERERALRGTLALRQNTVHAILNGDPVDVASAERLLAHPVTRSQTAVVLWVGEDARPGGEHPAVELEHVADAFAAAAGAPKPLTVPAGVRSLWAWVAGDLRRGDGKLARLVPPGTFAAVGEPGDGLPGFRDSHRVALAAQRVALESRSPRAVTFYRDVELVALLTEDRATARRFCARELAGLGERRAAVARLRTTAQVYFDVGGNVRRCAELLGTHRNTVLYRIARIEELVGHPLGERQAELQLALSLVMTYGEELLSESA